MKTPTPETPSAGQRVARWRRIPAAGAVAVAAVVVLSAGDLSADVRIRPTGEQVLEESEYEVTSHLPGAGAGAPSRKVRAGTTRRRVVRRGDRLVLQESARLDVQTPSRIVEIHHDTSAIETLDGRVLEFDYLDLRNDASFTSGRLGKHGMLVGKLDDLDFRRLLVGLPRDVVSENGNARRLVTAALQEPSKSRWTRMFKEFSPSELLESQPWRDLEFSLIGTETLTFRGGTVETFRFRQIDPVKARSGDSTPMSFWLDRAGVLYKLEMEFRGDGEAGWSLVWERVK